MLLEECHFLMSPPVRLLVGFWSVSRSVGRSYAFTNYLSNYFRAVRSRGGGGGGGGGGLLDFFAGPVDTSSVLGNHQ